MSRESRDTYIAFGENEPNAFYGLGHHTVTKVLPPAPDLKIPGSQFQRGDEVTLLQVAGEDDGRVLYKMRQPVAAFFAVRINSTNIFSSLEDASKLRSWQSGFGRERPDFHRFFQPIIFGDPSDYVGSGVIIQSVDSALFIPGADRIRVENKIIGTVNLIDPPKV